MARNFFLACLFFVIVAGAGIGGYLFGNEGQIFDSDEDSAVPDFVKNPGTAPEIDNSRPIAFANHRDSSADTTFLPIIEKAFQNLNLETLKQAIVLRNPLAPLPIALQKTHFRFEPEIFQTLLLQLLAPQLNFLNLQLQFRYSADYHKAEVEISDQDNPEVSFTKIFQIKESNSEGLAG